MNYLFSQLYRFYLKDKAIISFERDIDSKNNFYISTNKSLFSEHWGYLMP